MSSCIFWFMSHTPHTYTHIWHTLYEIYAYFALYDYAENYVRLGNRTFQLLKYLPDCTEWNVAEI